ncbi:MAG: restriction endonuclease subunit S [Verrucomicrobia bacterium]|nr:restriction endonuclease subunit S [Verrucomicrobiota bacterium]
MKPHPVNPVHPVPPPWPKVRLGEVLRLDLDRVPVDAATTYPMVGVLSFGRGLFDREPVVNGKTSYRFFYRLKADHIVMSQLFGWEGALALGEERFAGKFLSPQFPTFLCDPSKLDRGFLGWLMRRPAFWEDLGSRASGMGDRRRTLTPEALFQCEIPLPPLAEQRRIVARIEELAAQIEQARALRHQAAQQTEALVSSDLNARLSQAARQFGVRRMGDVAKCAAGFGFPKERQGRTGLKYPFAKVSDMNLPGNEREIRTAQNWIDDRDVAELGLKIYPVGTVIFPKIGGAIATNKRRLLALPGTFDNNVMGLIPSNVLLSEYLFVFMQSFDLTELQAGTSVPAISQSKVEELPVPVPPLSEQRRIAAELDALQAEVDRLKRLQAETAAELDALLPALLDRAFKGQL